MSHPSPNPPAPGSEPPAAARQAPPDPIRILHLEDDPTTTELVRERLRHEGLQVEIERVDTLPDFAQRLASRSHALILSDFTIPGMNTLEALRLAHHTRPDLPYIFLSGTLGEDHAVEALKQGATDYVLKDRIARLGPAVRRALQEAREQARRTQAEEALRRRAQELAAVVQARDEALAQLNALLANAPVGFAFFDSQQRYTRINDFLADEIDGLPAQAHLGRRVREILPTAAQGIEPLLQTIFACGKPVQNVVITAENPAAPGQQRFWLTAWFPVKTPDGRIPWVGAVIMDISQHKRTEAALLRRHQHLQLLHQATAGLLLGRQPLELLQRLHPLIAKAFGTEVFMLYQTLPGTGQLQLRGCAGLTSEQEHQLQKLRFGCAICAKPAEALHPIIATRLQSQPGPNRRLLRKLGFHSYLYFPLLLHDRLEGTLAFASRRREDFDQVDLDFFHTIARTLAEALERHRLESELQRHAQNLEQMVNERTAKLRETVAELEGFSYSLVHDLRAPLRTMNSYAGIIAEEAGPRLRPGEADLLRKIRSATTRMDHLITDSLNYTRILRQELPLGPVNLGALLRGMVETYPNLHPPQADITLEFPELTVYSNEAALTQIFSNLLGNAVKFVAPGTHPRVRLWAEPSTINPQPSTLIYVQDNGIGIPKDQQEKIFGMFQRLHREDQYPGTGIGLALVRKSLERMGGHISVQSEPGQGSTFCLELPTVPVTTPSGKTSHTE